MDKFLALDRIIRDAYVANDKELLLRVAGMLSLYSDERTLTTVLAALDTQKEKA